MSHFVPFDQVLSRVLDLVQAPGAVPDNAPDLYLIRNLLGKVRLSVADTIARDNAAQTALRRLAEDLSHTLGAHAYPPGEALLLVDEDLLTSLGGGVRQIRPGVYWVDRLVTGANWWTVGFPERAPAARRLTLYSVKGGVGRTTTAVVLARHLAQRGERVLVVDLDLESPGLSSAMCGVRGRPEFGITDWFVEDLVGQSDQIIGDMITSPVWARDLEGDVHVAPAYGREPGEYLAKLGRVYMDTPEPWAERLERLLRGLEDRSGASVVLLESRSGLHDIAAATVTDLGAQVLLFATDSHSSWDDYEILFRHWHEQGLATSIREKLSIVSALTPDIDAETYLDGFRERSWRLFQEGVYDELQPGEDPAADRFAFDRDEEQAPHDPLPIYWNRGLAAGTSLRSLEEAPVALAYSVFLRRFVLDEVSAK